MDILIASVKHPFKDILVPIQQRPHFNGNQYAVYFCRVIGLDDETQYLQQLSELDAKLSLLGDFYLKFTTPIPIENHSEILSKIQAVFQNIGILQIENGAVISLLERGGVLEFANGTPYFFRLQNALLQILSHYLKSEKNQTVTTIKNFITKILIWTEKYVKPWVTQQDLYHCPKVLFYGDIKKHECYFLILLSLLGCDILYLHTEKDLELTGIEIFSQLSQVFYGKKRAVLMEFPVRYEPNKEIIAAPLMISSNPFEDITTSMNLRSAYVGPPAPVFPVYFYRVIGIQQDNENDSVEYMNQLFRCDQKLQTQQKYVKITESLPIPMGYDADYISKKVEQAIVNSPYLAIEAMISKLIQANLFPENLPKRIQSTIEKAYYDVLNLYGQKELQVTVSKVKNLAIKLALWLKIYWNQLKIQIDMIDNPKILFYGDIKQHEVYFLILLSKIGCDVLFIHTEEEKDTYFKQIDPLEEHSKLLQFNQTQILPPFPKEEIVTRKGTVAYHASKQLSDVIYGEDVGLFREWQYEEGVTKPITLRTTYDELKILWNEEARIRPEFKVENQIVYVPNLFAKIQGVTQDLAEYWNEVKYFCKDNTVHFISQVPFTSVTYQKQDLYAMAYLIQKSAAPSFEEWSQSRFYSYRYLKDSLQKLIYKKMIELIESQRFNIQTDDYFKLKIIMTLYHLDEEILKLLQSFDFTGQVPKLVLYHSVKDHYSIEDVITIAFLNLVGLDIVIFTPTKYNNIEHLLKGELFDSHSFPKVAFDLALPIYLHTPTTAKKSLFSKWFGR